MPRVHSGAHRRASRRTVRTSALAANVVILTEVAMAEISIPTMTMVTRFRRFIITTLLAEPT